VAKRPKGGLGLPLRDWVNIEDASKPVRGLRQRMITWRDRTQTISQWSIERGISPQTIWRRLGLGMSMDDAMQKTGKCVVPNRELITWRGETKTLSQWSRTVGISFPTLRKRRALGYALDDLFSKDSFRGKRYVPESSKGHRDVAPKR
jgi:hypothetical protein